MKYTFMKVMMKTQSVPSKLVQTHDDGSTDTYYTHKPIGKGGFSTVYEASRFKSDQKFAIKAISLANLKEKGLIKRQMEEIKIQTSLDHPNILHAYDYFQDDKNFYIILELCPYHSVYNLLKQKGKFSELEAADIIEQVLEGVKYLHQNSIIHRDLKLQNLLIGADCKIKISDFGISIKLSSKIERCYSCCGTYGFMCPEMLDDESDGYSFESDIWSIGVCTFLLLTGQSPFISKDKSKTEKHIMNAEYRIPSNTHLSSVTKDFIRSILQINPEKRPSISDLLNHPFITNSKQIPHVDFFQSLLDKSNKTYEQSPENMQFAKSYTPKQFEQQLKKSPDQIPNDKLCQTCKIEQIDQQKNDKLSQSLKKKKSKPSHEHKQMAKQKMKQIEQSLQQKLFSQTYKPKHSKNHRKLEEQSPERKNERLQKLPLITELSDKVEQLLLNNENTEKKEQSLTCDENHPSTLKDKISEQMTLNELKQEKDQHPTKETKTETTTAEQKKTDETNKEKNDKEESLLNIDQNESKSQKVISPTKDTKSDRIDTDKAEQLFVKEGKNPNKTVDSPTNRQKVEDAGQLLPKKTDKEQSLSIDNKSEKSKRKSSPKRDASPKKQLQTTEQTQEKTPKKSQEDRVIIPQTPIQHEKSPKKHIKQDLTVSTEKVDKPSPNTEKVDEPHIKSSPHRESSKKKKRGSSPKTKSRPSQRREGDTPFDKNDENKSPQNDHSIPSYCVLRFCTKSKKGDLFYLMKNGQVGMISHDHQRLVLDPYGEFIQMWPKIDTNMPKILSPNEANKVKNISKLLKYAKAFNETNTVQLEIPQSKPQKGIPMRHVKYWMDNENGLLFRMDNRVIQVNFPDKTKLILFWEQKSLISTQSLFQNGIFMTFSNLKQSNNSELKRKYSITKKMIDEM